MSAKPCQRQQKLRLQNERSLCLQLSDERSCHQRIIGALPRRRVALIQQTGKTLHTGTRRAHDVGCEQRSQVQHALSVHHLTSPSRRRAAPVPHPGNPLPITIHAAIALCSHAHNVLASSWQNDAAVSPTGCAIIWATQISLGTT